MTARSGYVRKLGLLLLAVLFLSACTGDGTEFLGVPLSQSTPIPTATPVPTVPAVTPVPEEIDSDELDDHVMDTLLLWVPQAMDPANGSAAADILQAQLDAFVEQNPEVEIIVRVKAETGPASLNKSLTAVSAVAPLELPSLVILGHGDLETAAKQGLILPMGDYSTVINEVDWYQYARSLSVVGDSSYGFPLVGDALVMVARSENAMGTPKTWEEVKEQNVNTGFLVNDPESALILNYYMALGGEFVDEENKIVLEPTLLAQAYTLIQDLFSSNVLDESLTEYADYAEIWGSYLNGTFDLVIVPSSLALVSLPDDSRIIPLAPLTDYDYYDHSLAKGWTVALADPLPERRELSVALAESLTDVTFMGEWSNALGYMPVRETSFDEWDFGSTVVHLKLVSASAQNYPSQDVAHRVGPALQAGLMSLITEGVTPDEAALIVIENLTVEE